MADPKPARAGSKAPAETAGPALKAGEDCPICEHTVRSPGFCQHCGFEPHPA